MSILNPLLLLLTIQSKHTISITAAYLRQSLRLAVFVWVATTTDAISQPLIEEQQRLDFGMLAVGENTTVSRFTYPQTGNNISIEGQFVLISRGTPGRYRFSGFPAFTTLSVSIVNTTLTAGETGIPNLLTVDNYIFAEPTTDALGVAELSLGARLNTSGNGGSYVDAPYDGTTVLRVDYWQPEAGSFVSNSSLIEIGTELRSTLTISVEQQLHFGTLFARSSSTGQASLSVTPSGKYTINEPESSRLVSIARPTQGILRVSGAAPNYNLTITPQAEDVLLEHTQFPNSAPHFILSSLITSPDGTGTSDSNGELLITIGGTLKTEQTTSPVIYPSGQYEGIYQITVSY